MKPITIHPGSALAGAVALGLVLFCVSAAQESARQSSSQTTFVPVFPTATPIKVEVTNLSDIVLEGPVELAGQPHPRDFVAVELHSRNAAHPPWSQMTVPGVDVSSLTVPPGRLFIVTYSSNPIGIYNGPGGQFIGIVLSDVLAGTSAVTVHSGMTLERFGGVGSSHIGGYLVDA